MCNTFLPFTLITLQRNLVRSVENEHHLLLPGKNAFRQAYQQSASRCSISESGILTRSKHNDVIFRSDIVHAANLEECQGELITEDKEDAILSARMAQRRACRIRVVLELHKAVDIMTDFSNAKTVYSKTAVATPYEHTGT